MLCLFAEPKPTHHGRQPERCYWRTILFGAAIAAVVTATQPWIRVKFVQLFGEVLGPPAWQGSTAGFTCLCTSALVATMTLVETKTQAAREAVRPASLLLAIVMALSLLLHLLRGPGSLRGVTATWTVSFYVGAAATVLLLAACLSRFFTAQRYRNNQHPGH